MFGRRALLFLILTAISIAFSWLREPGPEKGFIIGYLGNLFFAVLCFMFFRKSLGSFFIIMILLIGSAFKGLSFFTEDSLYFTKVLPDIISNMLGALTGISFYIFRGNKKYFLPLASLIYIFFLWAFGYQAWMHKMNYGSYSPEMEKVTPAFTITNLQGQVLTNKDFQDRIIVYYFWSVGCKPCFEGLAQLHEMYNQYKYDKMVEIYAVTNNTKLTQATDELKAYGYAIDVLEGNAAIAESFEINWLPTVIILDEDGNTVYKGALNGVDEKIQQIK